MKFDRDSVPCTICGDITDFLFPLYDDRYGFPGVFEIYRCPACSHCTLAADFSNNEIIDLYSNYYPRSDFSLDDFKPRKEVSGFSAWLNGERRSAYAWVPENVRILDVGCGFGETLAYHKERGCDVYGVEADENIKRVADKFGFNVHVGFFDSEIYEPDFFDYVTFDQVIEHCPDPLETFKGLSRILKPGGVAILSTPNANGWGARAFGRFWINWHTPYHVEFFSSESISLAAEQSDLKVEKIKTITSSEWLLYQWIHLITFPKQGVPSIFWTQSSSKSLIEKYTLYILSIFHRTKVNHMLTRAFDSLGVGDNYLFFLRKNG